MSLTITLFGPMRVQVDGQPLPHLRNHKTLWLLALLILRQGRPVEREWLGGMLWPDTVQDRSLGNLRPVLSALRRALGGESERLQSPSRHTLSLDLSGADVDVQAFDFQIANKTLSALAQAVALYTGPLLEGCAEEWVPQERRVREETCLQALQTLAEAALAAGQHATATDYFRRAVDLDPWQEEARRGLMRALDYAGDSNAAVQVYRDFAEMLRKDIRATPDNETKALYDRLRSEAKRRAVKPHDILKTGTDKADPIVSGHLVRGHLPHPLTELIGREDEKLDVAAKLWRSRLVTLTGPGGIGKTRLAGEVAAQAVCGFADGAWLVPLEALLPLEALSDGTQVVRQIATNLELKEEPGQLVLESLVRHLRPKKLLLLLDNCEHLLPACRSVAAHLLRECAGVRILATSREPLGIPGEMIWAVPALTTPEPAHLPSGRATLVRVLIGYESVQLFVGRAQAVQKGFELAAGNASAVAHICAHLQGIPLAIELAAARVNVLSAAQIAARLDDQLSLLTGGKAAPVRHQTLRAALDWSCDLLNDSEQILLRRLSVFAGGWTLDAAETVCTGEGLATAQVLDLLSSLTDKSLVLFEPADRSLGAEEGASSRYRLLETVRQYAAERLTASGEADRVRFRHRNCFLTLAEDAEPQLSGVVQKEWLDRLEAEHSNLRAALAWCEREPNGVQAGLRLTGALLYFWKIRGYFGEARQCFQQVLAWDGADEATLARAKVLGGAGVIAQNQGEIDLAQALHEESLGIFRALGHKQGIAKTINNLGGAASARGDYSSARMLYEESLVLSRELGDRQGIALALGNVGNEVRCLGDYAAARKFLEESLDIRRELQGRTDIAMALSNLGNVVRLQGDYTAAQALIEESLDIRREMGDRKGIAYSLSFLSSVVCSQGNFQSAHALAEESLSIRRQLGDKARVAWSLLNLSKIIHLQGDYTAARTLIEESLAQFREIGSQGGIAWALSSLGEVRHRQGDCAAAWEAERESLCLFQKLKDQEGLAASLRILSAQSEGAKAARLGGAAEVLRQTLGAPLLPFEQEEHEQQITRVRSVLGNDLFTASWAEGRALSWEQAVDYALAG